MYDAKLIKALLALAVQTPVAMASWGAWGGYGDPSGVMNVAANSDFWSLAIANSNASAEYSFTGRDVSKPWPGEAMEGWKLNLTVVDMSGQGANINWDDDSVYYSSLLVGDDYRIIAPESLLTPSKNASDDGKPVVNTHDDWVFCAWRWFNPGYSNVSAYRNPDNLDVPEDGSCEQFISKECIEAVEKAARTSYHMNKEPKGIYGSRHVCSEFKIPDVCGQDSSKGTPLSRHYDNLPNFGIPIQYLNGSTTWQGGYNIDKDNHNETQLMWRALTQDIQPILTLFGKHHNNSDEFDVEPGFTKLSCIRAVTRSEKSSGNANKDNNDDAEGAAAGLGNRSSMLIASVLAMLSWFL